MSTPAVKAELVSALGRRFGSVFRIQDRPPVETLPTGIPELDAQLGGIPRGALTEICGAGGTGRTSLLLALLAQATARQEACALVDAGDALDPESAAAAGVDLDRLLWVRCGGRLEQALTAADWLVHAGGFGVVALDLGDAAPEQARRIPLAGWYRLRRAVESTPAALVVVATEPWAKSCSSLVLEMTRERALWQGRLLRGLTLRVERRKPARAAAARFEVRMVA